MCLDKNSDANNVIRRIGNQKRKPVLYRDRRPHLLAEEVEYIPDIEGKNRKLILINVQIDQTVVVSGK